MAAIASAVTRVRFRRSRSADRWRNPTVYEPPAAQPAIISVHLHLQTAGSYILDVTNDGPGVARGVFVAPPAQVHPPVMLRTPLPIQLPTLHPGDRQTVPLHTTGNGLLELTVDVGWIDSRGDRGATFTLHG